MEVNEMLQADARVHAGFGCLSQGNVGRQACTQAGLSLRVAAPFRVHTSI